MDLSYKQTINQKNFQLTGKVDFESKGGVGALTPAIALQVTPKLSLGVAVNFYTDEFFGAHAWKQTTRQTGSGRFYSTDFTTVFSQDEIFKNAQAVNVTTGLLWDVWEKGNKRLTFGAVYDTPFTAELDYIQKYTTFTPPYQPVPQSVTSPRQHFEIDLPMSFGAGLGFRYSDALSFSMDVTWTDWSEYILKGENVDNTRPLGFDTPARREVDDTYTVRCGSEYLIFREKMIVPVRGGLFYDPRPSLDSPIDVYGFSVGSGVTFKRFSIDGAYQFRWSTNADGEDIGLKGIPFNFNEHMFLASVIVYF